MLKLREKISHFIDLLHLKEFSLRTIVWLTRRADLPVVGRVIRLLGNLYTRYLIHGETLPWTLKEHTQHHSGHLHTVIDHNKALSLIAKEKDICLIDCKCRSIAKGCDAPLNVCILVGAEAHRRNKISPDQKITAEKAVSILHSCFDKNLIHNAIYSFGYLVELCNCCKCCCIPLLGVRQGFKSLLPSNYIASISESQCTSCGICETICPFQAISKGTIDVDKCFGCGLCAYKCPQKAIQMKERIQKK